MRRSILSTLLVAGLLSGCGEDPGPFSDEAGIDACESAVIECEDLCTYDFVDGETTTATCPDYFGLRECTDGHVRGIDGIEVEDSADHFADWCLEHLGNTAARVLEGKASSCTSELRGYDHFRYE